MTNITSAPKTRIALWDNCKFLLVYLVVLGHVANQMVDTARGVRIVFMLIYLFHMPAFVFISGLFSKRNINEKRYTHIFEYLLLYIFFNVYMGLVRMAILGEINFQLFATPSAPWYAFALFAFCMITIFLRRLPPCYLMVMTLVLGCMIGYDRSVGDFLALGRIFVFYPFFLAGYYLEPDQVAAFVKKKPVKIAAVLLFVAVTVILYLHLKKLYPMRMLLTAHNNFDFLERKILKKRFGGFMYGGLVRAGYYVISGLMTVGFIALVPAKESILSRLGRRSMAVYTFHMAGIYFLIRPLELLGGKTLVEYLGEHSMSEMMFVVALVITLFFSLPVFTKILDYVVHPKWRTFETDGGNT